MTEESANGLEEQGVLSLDMEENCLAMKYYMYSGLITETVSTFTDESKAEEEEIPHAPTVDTTYRETIDTSEYESGSITSTTIGDSRSIQIDQSVFDTEEWQTFCDHVTTVFSTQQQKLETEIKEAQNTIEEKKKLLTAKLQEFDGRDKGIIDKLELDISKIKETHNTLKKAEAKKQNLRDHKYDEEFSASLPDDSIFTEEYRHRYTVDAAVDITPLVTRYGICSDKFSHLCGAISLDMLHPVEFYVLSKAIEHLLEIPDDIEGYKENVVLCDLVVRNGDDKTISSPLEMHSVALWRNIEGKIILIDPTAVSFSQIILQHSEHSIFTEKIVSDPIQEKYTRFYSKGGKEHTPGRNLSDPRDCIDVAVKVAFELNELQRTLQDSKKILEILYDKMANGDNKGFQTLKLSRDAHSSDAKTREQFLYMYQAIKDLKFMHPLIQKQIFNPGLYKQSDATKKK